MALTDYRKYRLLEMIPGTLVWLTFLLTFALSFIRPLWVITFIILFDLYWLLRVVYLMSYLLMVYRRFRTDTSIDWWQRLQAVPGWQSKVHVIVLPTVNEPFEILDATFAGLAASTFPASQFIVVLSVEEAYAEQGRMNADRLREKYGGVFRSFLFTIHPRDLPGELPGKGSNAHWAGRKVKEFIDEQRLSYDDVIVSNFDIDTAVHPQFFSYLTYRYCTVKDPTRASYQPIPLFHNNIWDVPAFMRVVSNGTTFWLMSEQFRPERMFTFSSHSMSFRALVDVGFWQNDIVTEDSRIFLQGLLRYDGDYRIEPMYIPVSMDAVHGSTLWESIKNLYKQQRRWAWGVEHFPYMLWNFPKSGVPRYKKWKYTFTLLEGMYSWATSPIIIFLMGHLPLWVAPEGVLETAVAQNAPFVLQTLLILAMIGLLCAAILSVLLLPKKPSGVWGGKIPLMLLEWILFPITMIVFGSIPATEAQTRLLFGKYLGFHLTKKVRLKV